MIENLRVLRYFMEAKGIRRISILESEEYWNIEIKLEFESIFFFVFCEIENWIYISFKN